MNRFLLALALAMSVSICLAQVNFKKDYLDNNPIESSNTLNHDDQITIHEAFLQKAINQQDTLNQIYGLFYLFADYYKTNDYVELKKIVLKAQKIIDKNSKPEWQAALLMRTAYIVEIIDKNVPQAIEQYKNAISLCNEAKDTLCIAESLEQLSNLNKNLNNYELAEGYFKEAVVLMEKYASPSGIALTYSNYSLLASDQGKYKIAEEYIDKAIDIAIERQDTFTQVMYVSNKASILLGQQRYRDAIELYHDVLPINIRNNWSDNLIYNYAGLVNSYEDLGDFEKSNIYLQKYYELKESLEGAVVQKKIDQLEMKDQLYSKELALKEKESQLQKSINLRDRLLAMALILGLSCLALYYFWHVSRRNSKKEKEHHLNYINDLRKILKAKNTEIHEWAEKSDSLLRNEHTTTTHKIPLDEEIDSDPDYKIFDARIINDEGIIAFKSYFDKIYPGLLIRVRERWPSISDAEERLLMLIKLRIKTKEASDILGISQSSVKKSRNRLRKRLEIESSIDLENFVQEIR